MIGRSGAYGMRTPLVRCFLLLIVIVLPTLTGCGGAVKSEGSVALYDEAGNPLSFTGATATLFPLNAAIVIPGQTPKGIGAGIVAADGSSVTLSARASAIRNARLYVVEFRCPAAVPDDDCEVEAPLHMVLSGAQIRAGGWQATVLTEAVFQNTTYAVATKHTATQVRQELDSAAAVLLIPSAAGDAATYSAVLAWNPADTMALQRPGQVADFAAALIAGASRNDVQLQAQQLTNLLISTLALEGFVQDVALSGARAFLVGSRYDSPGALHVVDISDPSKPVLTAMLDELGNAKKLQVAGDYAYVVDEGEFASVNSSALHIISLADPDQPELVASFTIAGRATDVAIAGGYAFVSQQRHFSGDPGFAGLQIIDISNPLSPAHVANLAVATGLNHLALSGNRVYATGQGGLHVIDVSNPVAPTVVGAQQYSTAPQDIVVSGQYAYLTVGNTLRIIDIESPSLPVVGSLTGVYGQHLTIVGDRLYAGPDVIDISLPFAPQRVERLNMGIYSTVVTPNGFAYTAAVTSLNIHDTNVAGQPVLLEGQTPVEIDHVVGLTSTTVAADGFAYAPKSGGMLIFDLSNPLAPQHIATSLLPYIFELTLAPPYAYSGNNGVGNWMVLDISNPAAVEYELPVIGSADTGGYDYISLNTIALAGHYAFGSYTDYTEDPDTGSAVYIGGMHVIDVQIPSDPQIVANHNAATSSSTVAVAGNHAYLMLDNGSVEVIDVSDPVSPVLVYTLPLPGNASTLVISGDVLYASAGSLGLHIISITDPATPMLLATVDTPGNAGPLVVDSGYAYMADNSGGVQVVSVANPASPVLLGAAKTNGSANGVFLYDNYLYAATSYGFEILRKIPTPIAAP